MDKKGFIKVKEYAICVFKGVWVDVPEEVFRQMVEQIGESDIEKEVEVSAYSLYKHTWYNYNDNVIGCEHEYYTLEHLI